jgi:hypothetical protein
MAEKTERAQRPARKAKFIKVPNRIRSKVTGGGPISESMLKTAEQILLRHSADYVSRAEEQIEILVKTVQEAKLEEASRPVLFANIFKQSHDIRGLGSTFGYELMTEIGGSLCTFLEGIERRDDAAMEVVSAHVDALCAVLANNVKGDGGLVGREITDILAKAITK